MTKPKYPNLTKAEALKLAWKNRNDYKGYDKTKGGLFNTWRSIVYTKKGKLKGYPETWKTFEGFLADIPEGWERGNVLCRLDIKKPYSKDNIEWRKRGEECIGRLSQLEYNGTTKTLVEWCEEYSLNYNGVRQRFSRGKNYTPEQILFGKKKRLSNTVTDVSELTTEQLVRTKINKIYGQYKLSDKKRGYDFDIQKEWLFNEILNGKCFYCEDTKRLGLDRIDNSKGHTMDNVVVACYDCNCARNNNFSHDEMVELGKTIKEIKRRRNEGHNKERIDG